MTQTSAPPSSPLLNTLSLLLHGSCASIEALLAQLPHDPGAPTAQEALNQIKRLHASLSPTSQKPIHHNKERELLSFFPSEENTAIEQGSDPLDLFGEDEASSTPPPSALSLSPSQGSLKVLSSPETNPTRLIKSLQKMTHNAGDIFLLPEHLWSSPLQTIWWTCNLHLLRLPVQEMKRWHENLLHLAQEEGFQLSSTPASSWPSFAGQPFTLPSLSCKGTELTGITFQEEAPLPPEIASLTSSSSLPNFDSWQKAAALLCSLLQYDLSLHHALHAVNRFDIVPLDNPQREQYKKHLLMRLRHASLAPTALEQMHFLWEVDEAFHSLLPQPLPSTNSWWERFFIESRELLFQTQEYIKKQTQSDISLLELPADYRSIYEKKLTDDDLAISEGKQPGKVLASLRLWMKINGKISLGRVIYRR